MGHAGAGISIGLGNFFVLSGRLLTQSGVRGVVVEGRDGAISEVVKIFLGKQGKVEVTMKRLLIPIQIYIQTILVHPAVDFVLVSYA